MIYCQQKGKHLLYFYCTNDSGMICSQTDLYRESWRATSNGINVAYECVFHFGLDQWFSNFFFYAPLWWYRNINNNYFFLIYFQVKLTSEIKIEVRNGTIYISPLSSIFSQTELLCKMCSRRCASHSMLSPQITFLYLHGNCFLMQPHMSKFN